MGTVVLNCTVGSTGRMSAHLLGFNRRHPRGTGFPVARSMQLCTTVPNRRSSPTGDPGSVAPHRCAPSLTARRHHGTSLVLRATNQAWLDLVGTAVDHVAYAEHSARHHTPLLGLDAELRRGRPRRVRTRTQRQRKQNQSEGAHAVSQLTRRVEGGRRKRVSQRSGSLTRLLML